MGAFVTGRAEAVVDAAIEENTVYTRLVSLRMTSGQMLDVWDEHPLISRGMAIGESYQVIIVMTRATVSVVDALPDAPQADDRWQGVIVRTDWRAAREAYRHARPDLFAHEWALIDTPVGQMLMQPADLPPRTGVGAHFRTLKARFELYAIV